MGKRGPKPGTGGRPRKNIAEKIIEGNPGKRRLEVIEFQTSDDLRGNDMPIPDEYLSSEQAVKNSALKAVEIYKKTWEWLNDRKCAHLISPQMLERYAMSEARLIQVEEALSKYGFVSKHPTTGAPCTSPFVSMVQSFHVQTSKAWAEIFQIVKENCMTEIGGSNPRDDMMEMLLSRKKTI